MDYYISSLKRLGKDDEGAITPFILALFLIMVVGGGMAVDFMRQETMRADLQDALDRGILSAASFRQGSDPAVVVADYLNTRAFSEYNVTLNVDSQLTLNSRTVTADASIEVGTFFLKLLGINSLTAVAHGVAEEAISNVEISLVLDISGSMGENGKLGKLKDAGYEFIDTILTDMTRAQTTVSIVPYSAQVNPGLALASKYNLNVWQNYDYCFVMNEDDYTRTGISPTLQYEQAQHWGWTYGYYWCPNGGGRILPYSNNNTVLKNMISNLRAEGNTSSYLGMKWGVALLDPGTQPVVSGLVADGLVDATFANRPAPYDDKETLKVVVLMTDGVNTYDMHVKSSVYGDNNQDNADHWNGNPIPYSLQYLDIYVGPTDGDTYLDNICTAAKEAGIIVYTIGFEVAGTDAEPKMRSCASTPGNFFLVEGVEISDAFRVIAADINKLKLIE